MAIDYTKTAALAQRLITENGRTIHLVKPSEVPIDPSKPWLGSTSSESLLTVPAVMALPNQVRIFGLSGLGLSGTLEGLPFEATKGLVQLSELVYIIYQGDNDIREYTHVRDGGVDHTIIATQELKPGNKIILGFLGVRR